MHRQLTPNQSILALDVGDVRIGVARAGALAKLPEPLPTVKNDESIMSGLQKIIEDHQVGLIVVGLPRNLKGEETGQTAKIREFAERLDSLGVEYVFADESLSSKRADNYLRENKKSTADQDSLAACFILEEFFTTIGQAS